jgi:glycosyltransferase involved in cell wall biosynthesis
MKNSYKAFAKEHRKKILLMCDDIRYHSGVANMARELVINTAHHFNWVQIGAALSHPEVGKVLDLSASVNETTGLQDASLLIYPSSGYGTPTFVRAVLEREKPDAVFIFTDPRYWVWLFEMERELRTNIPLFYLNIWDNYPAPMYNKPYYDSCDVLMAISKQTLNINKLVLGQQAEGKIIRYVPHGVDPTVFYPIRGTAQQQQSFNEFKSTVFGDRQFDFVAFFNSRNIRRKQPGDVILGYRLFCDLIGKEKASKCALLMHTNAIEEQGPDLIATKNALCDPELNNVFFSPNKLSEKQMNLLYNLADVNVLVSSAEGWGLSVTEAMMAGTMSIVNVTGGIQDQCRFEDENGNWIDFSADFPSNHKGTYTKHGQWVEPIFAASTTLVGSVPTPYIYEDRVTPEQIAQALLNVYNMSPQQRDTNAEKGRQWAMGPEAGFTSEHMANRIIDVCDEGLAAFVPRPSYEVCLADAHTSTFVQHKLANY